MTKPAKPDYAKHGSPQQLRSNVVSCAVAMVLEYWQETVAFIKTPEQNRVTPLVTLHLAVCTMKGWDYVGDKPQ